MKMLVAVCFMLLVLPTMVMCDSDEDNSLCPELVIESVFPFVASANDPVLIKGTGFSSENMTVRFGSLIQLL